MAELDPTLYNGPARQERTLPDLKSASVPESGPEVSLDATMSGTAQFQQAEQMRIQNSRLESTAWEAVKGAAGQWLTTGLADYAMKPTFEPDGSSASEQLQHAQIVLTDDEAALFSKRKSIEEGNYYLDSIRRNRTNGEAMQDHMGLAMITSGIDPVTWLIPFGTTKAVAGAAKAGIGVNRLGQAGLAVGASAALTGATAQVRPVSDSEIWLNAVLEGTAAALMKPGKSRTITRGDTEIAKPKLEQVDPDFPAKELQEIVKPTPVVAPAVEDTGLMGKAIGNEGEITLRPAKDGQFELSYMDEGQPVKELFSTHEQAMDAFDDAVDYAEATVSSRMAAKSSTVTGPVKDVTMYEDAGLGNKTYPEDLAPGMPHEPAKAQAAVEKLVEAEQKTLAQRTGEKLQINIRKSMAKFNKTTSEIADTLFDNNSNLGITSMESHQRAIKSELKTGMWQFDEQLKGSMAESGWGLRKQILDSTGGAAKHQAALEREVNLEMLRRHQTGMQGRTISHEGVIPQVKEMADSLDRIAKQVDQEMKAAGVKGAENIQWKSGWASRKWSSVGYDEVVKRIQKYGHSEKEAHKRIVKMVAESFADANPGMAWEVAHDAASATINRSIRKGAFEDAAFTANQGADSAKVVRDMLKADGLSGARLQRVMDVLIGKADEKGKAGFLKHRVDMDYTTNLDLGGEQINVTDLFDHGIKNTFDRYIDRAATEIAFARKGLTEPSAITALRTKGIESIPVADVAKREEFVNLFDESVKALRGEPSGVDIGQGLRNAAAISRLTTLGSVGYWQLTEYAKMAQRYGIAKTVGYFVRELPPFKHALETLATNKFESTHLKDILTHATEESTRIQPYVRRFADGFEMPANATLSARLQHAAQLVPYMNGLKWIHGHQARMMANLTIDSINRAVLGDAKMAKVLEQYGVTPEMLTTLKSDVTQHGMQTEKWSDGAWANVRPAFSKMMDEGVLHARLGDTPAFALLNPVGKFICTYRNFVLTAHNKLLAGTLGREGFDGIGLMLMYQYPLSALMVQAQTTINNKKPLSTKELAAAALGQTGGIGLIGEVAGLLTGSKTQIGAPGMIPFDRAAKLVGEVGKDIRGKGSAAETAHAAFQLTPFLAILPPIKAMEGWGMAKHREAAQSSK